MAGLCGRPCRLAPLLPVRPARCARLVTAYSDSLGLYGMARVQQFGQDDAWSWLLIPLLGFTIAGCALTAIVYGLAAPEKWNAKFNPTLQEEASPGRTNWLTIGAIVFALMIGATSLMSSIVFSFQRYFQYQIEESRKLSQ